MFQTCIFKYSVKDNNVQCVNKENATMLVRLSYRGLKL